MTSAMRLMKRMGGALALAMLALAVSGCGRVETGQATGSTDAGAPAAAAAPAATTPSTPTTRPAAPEPTALPTVALAA